MSSQRAESAHADEGTRHSVESVREPQRDVGRSPSHSLSESHESVAPAPDPPGDQARAFAHIAELLEHVVQGGVARPARADKPALERLAKRKTRTFTGTKGEESETAEDWLEDMGRVLDEIQCSEEESVKCIVSLLQGDAYRWWSSIVNTMRPEAVTWDFFQQEFRKNYVGQSFLDEKRLEFLYLKQRDSTVMEYKIKFVRLSKYGPELIPSNREKCRKFKEGLHLDLQKSLLALETEDFNKLVEKAVDAERLRDKERGQSKRKFDLKRGASSARSQDKKPKMEVTRFPPRNPGGQGKSNWPAPSAASTPSVNRPRSEAPVCSTCNNKHWGECRRLSGACFNCGEKGHLARECPRGRTGPRAPASGATSAPKSVKLSQKPEWKGTTSGPATKAEGKAPARTYAMRGREEADTPDVVTGTFHIFGTPVFTLIDPGSTLSYVCNEILADKGWESVETDDSIVVSTPLGQEVIVNRVYREVPLEIEGEIFKSNLLELKNKEFDVILGMDWLSQYGAQLDCRTRKITFHVDKKVTVVGGKRNRLGNVISATIAAKLLQ